MAASWAGLIGMAVAFALGLEHGEKPGDALLATIWGTSVALGAAVATVFGLRALFTLHDRAGSVIAATVLAGLLLLIVLREAAQGLGLLGS